MSRRVVVIGAGMGGLAAALRLVRHGYRVRLIEARSRVGGLASSIEKDGFVFDGGPYVLLDRSGLEWAFHALGLDLDEQVPMVRIQDFYEVSWADGFALRFHADLGGTADGFDRLWPGSGQKYVDLVTWAQDAYARLRPLLFVSRPGVADVLRTGAWRASWTVARSLESVLRSRGLPDRLAKAVAIWTHIAGQRPEEAPSFLAFVPAMFHGAGAYYPTGGVGVVPEALARAAAAAGVEIETRARVRAIHCVAGRATAVETEAGDRLDTDAVVSNVGLATYLDLLRPASEKAARRLAALPLQSPGVATYLRVSGVPRPPYLRFRIDDEGCRLFIAPRVVDSTVPGDAWPARLLAPMDYAVAARVGRPGQEAYLDRLLAEDWWRDGLDEIAVVERRIPASWGTEFHLHADAMNPVMTARLMRAGRLAHRSPWVERLYLAGSATHPGQWVSFCAISGILAADRVVEDFG